MISPRQLTLLKVIIHGLAFSWLAGTFYLALVDQLGGDPVKALIHFTGMGALNCLLLSLVISPLARFTKQAWLMKVRRLIGLYAFFYALAHVLSFVAFDLVFDFSLFAEELLERPYLWLGMLAFLILFVMAITSVNRIKRAMKHRWQQLHNFVYLAVLLVVWHFYWSVKAELVEPVIYALITLLLLVLRKNKFNAWFKYWFKP